MRQILTVCGVLVTTLGWHGQALAQPERPAAGVTATFQGPARVVQHEPILIEFHAVNRTAETVAFDLGANWKENLDVRIRTPDGTILSPPRRSVWGAAIWGMVTLEPGTAFRREFVLNEWAALDVPGTYHVQIAIDAEFRTESGALVQPVVGGLVEVEVGAHDEMRLRRICDRLAQRAIDASTAQELIDAEWALSYVDHPIAVASWRRILSEAPFPEDSLIIRGLLRIGTIEARDVLVEMYQTSDLVRVERLNQALQQFELRER